MAQGLLVTVWILCHLYQILHTTFLVPKIAWVSHMEGVFYTFQMEGSLLENLLMEKEKGNYEIFSLALNFGNRQFVVMLLKTGCVKINFHILQD